MKTFQGRTAVVTGAASGFGLEVARIAAREGMHVVMADVQADALDRAAAEIGALGAQVLPWRLDVADAAAVDALGAAVAQRFGAPHVVFNNAGVGAGGLVWETSAATWDWVVGVNLMGVAHGVRVFTPLMLEAAGADAGYEGHIVNTASMAGVTSPPNMGVYNATKHAVVALTETLYQDLSLVTTQVTASVLCPFFVPTGIAASHRNRPDAEQGDAPPTASQRVAAASTARAVGSGKLGAADIAALVFEGLREKRFYLFSHPQALDTVRLRMEDILQGRNPSDPFAARPELRQRLVDALRDA